MLKPIFIIFSTILFLIFCSCSNKQKPRKSQPDCDIITTVYDTFMKIHKNELKYMNLDRFYICNFDFIQTDTSTNMKNKPKFMPSDDVFFDKSELLEIGNFCLRNSKIQFIDPASANDTILLSKTTNKVIWGITNFRKNSKYVYLIFGSHFGRSAIIADEYLLESKNGKFEIIDVNPISQ